MNICNKLEVAAKKFIDTLAIVGLSAEPGQNNTEKTQPVVICEAGRATEDFPESGIYHVPLTITVGYSAADYTADDIDIAASAIFEAFLGDTTIDDLKAVEPDFDIYQILVAGQDTSFSGDAWIQTLQLEVVAVLTPPN